MSEWINIDELGTKGMEPDEMTVHRDPQSLDLAVNVRAQGKNLANAGGYAEISGGEFPDGPPGSGDPVSCPSPISKTGDFGVGVYTTANGWFPICQNGTNEFWYGTTILRERDVNGFQAISFDWVRADAQGNMLSSGSVSQFELPWIAEEAATPNWGTAYLANAPKVWCYWENGFIPPPDRYHMGLYDIASGVFTDFTTYPEGNGTWGSGQDKDTFPYWQDNAPILLNGADLLILQNASSGFSESRLVRMNATTGATEADNLLVDLNSSNLLIDIAIDSNGRLFGAGSGAAGGDIQEFNPNTCDLLTAWTWTQNAPENSLTARVAYDTFVFLDIEAPDWRIYAVPLPIGGGATDPTANYYEAAEGLSRVMIMDSVNVVAGGDTQACIASPS